MFHCRLTRLGSAQINPNSNPPKGSPLKAHQHKHNLQDTIQVKQVLYELRGPREDNTIARPKNQVGCCWPCESRIEATDFFERSELLFVQQRVHSEETHGSKALERIDLLYKQETILGPRITTQDARNTAQKQHHEYHQR